MKEKVVSRVLRGGSWYHGPIDCRLSCRHWIGSDYRQDSYGFRVVRTVNTLPVEEDEDIVDFDDPIENVPLEDLIVFARKIRDALFMAKNGQLKGKVQIRPEAFLKEAVSACFEAGIQPEEEK